jgi:hypothetical protein
MNCLLETARAAAAMQPHLRDVRLDIGNLDAVVDVNRVLRDTPDSSARQCGQCSARTSRLGVGFGCSGRCTPACAFRLGCWVISPLLFCPFAGGVLSSSGVFGAGQASPAALRFLPATPRSRLPERTVATAASRSARPSRRSITTQNQAAASPTG